MKFKFLLIACFTMLASCWAGATETPGSGENEVKKTDIAGGVYDSDTKKPINSVTVTVYAASKKEKSVLSDANGAFSFDDLKPGTYKFVFEKDGYKKLIKEKTIVRADEGRLLNVAMEEHPAFDFTPGPSHFFDFN